MSSGTAPCKAAGMEVVRGWAVPASNLSNGSFLQMLEPRYEHLDKAISEAFVAERFWWNSLPDCCSEVCTIETAQIDPEITRTEPGWISLRGQKLRK